MAAGIQNEKTQLALLLLVLNGWPTYVGLTFLLLPFVLATRNLWDWFLLSCILSVMAATVVFEGTGIAFGPRYWYDIVPLIMLLSARGAERAAETVAVAAGFVRRAVSPSGTQTPSWAAAVVVYALVLSLIGGEVYGWVLGQRAGWRDISFSLGDGLQATFVPESASLLRGFNGVDDRLVTLVDGADLHNALVLVEPCPNWQCYGNLAWLNSPDLNGDVVFAKDLPERRAELFKVYADRRVYVADYLKSSLAPYGAASTSDTGRPLAEAPLAKNISSQPTPVATAVPADAGRRDEERRQDLALVAQSLELYFEKHKVYPVAPTLQALCGTPLNAGCALKEVLDPLPVDPAPGGTYSYQSDGTSFILVAFLEAGSAADACPDPPQQLRIFTNLYCVGSRSSSTP